ncbi:origin recognition complex subunit 1 [Chanos chanos]|uniref:Origin recognition complex subunit 1 n=1 Tax=Chanos chanos TaxID=29144 RepID=A0A6J2WUE0_CHACN|nr:origin recognition complex subunit 1 [Chanos chanos]
MSRYFTRLRVRRTYKLQGRPTSEDRKLKRSYYESFTIAVEGHPNVTTVSLGEHILIEGDNEDNPYVAQLLKLFSDGETQKKAVVQWFVRMCEIPPMKRKLLGREPHPQEVFFYQDRSCDSEVDVESILGTVQMKFLPAEAPFPETETKDTLFVKLSWDTKTFSVLHPDLMQPPQNPKTPPPASQRASRGGRPTPDPAVMNSAMSSRVSMSAGKMSVSEAESVHSASKLSAAKQLSAKRRRAASGPSVRKKLELHGLDKKVTGAEMFEELLAEDLETEKALAQELSASPPRAISISVRLTPLKSPPSPAENKDRFSLHPLKSSDKPLPASPDSKSLDLNTVENDAFEPDPVQSSGRTPRRREATPRRFNLRGQKARTPSRRKDSVASRETGLAVLAEEDHEDSPVQPVVLATPRSKRKSAQLVSSRIRKQLNLLGNELLSDGEEDDPDDDENFILSKMIMQSSSEENEEEEDETKEDSEDELVVKKSRRKTGSRTPQSAKKSRASARTPRKTPSKKMAPSTPRTPRYATPSIPSRTQPARTPGNVLEEARARLHVSSVPESLPCREQEFQDIYSFVESKIIDGTGGCMYISGVPGTGKTATVHEVIRSLQQAAEQDEIPQFRFIEINGMKMTDPHQAYVQILQKLSDQKATPDHAAALLEKRFSNPAPKKETTVLLVDELDLLWTRKQNVMYNLFDWPTRRHARLVVLTIANTMDLPERIMINRVASRLGLTRMSFQPYSFKQLQQIITSRLNRVKAFEEDALQLVSRKVAALSGDARRCLDICRRATEICEHDASDKNTTGLVNMSHVMAALDEMFSSSYITAISCASVQEQLFLRAVITEFRRLGLEEATFQQVFLQHQALCRVEGLQPLSVSEGLAVCQRLGSSRLLLLEPSRLDVLLRVRLNVSQDDVLYALKTD